MPSLSIAIWTDAAPARSDAHPGDADGLATMASELRAGRFAVAFVEGEDPRRPTKWERGHSRLFATQGAAAMLGATSLAPFPLPPDLNSEFVGLSDGRRGRPPAKVETEGARARRLSILARKRALAKARADHHERVRALARSAVPAPPPRVDVAWAQAVAESRARSEERRLADRARSAAARAARIAEAVEARRRARAAKDEARAAHLAEVAESRRRARAAKDEARAIRLAEAAKARRRARRAVDAGGRRARAAKEAALTARAARIAEAAESRRSASAAKDAARALVARVRGEVAEARKTLAALRKDRVAAAGWTGDGGDRASALARIDLASSPLLPLHRGRRLSPEILAAPVALVLAPAASARAVAMGLTTVGQLRLVPVGMFDRELAPLGQAASAVSEAIARLDGGVTGKAPVVRGDRRRYEAALARLIRDVRDRSRCDVLDAPLADTVDADMAAPDPALADAFARLVGFGRDPEPREDVAASLGVPLSGLWKVEARIRRAFDGSSGWPSALAAEMSATLPRPMASVMAEGWAERLDGTTLTALARLATAGAVGAVRVRDERYLVAISEARWSEAIAASRRVVRRAPAGIGFDEAFALARSALGVLAASHGWLLAEAAGWTSADDPDWRLRATTRITPTVAVATAMAEATGPRSLGEVVARVESLTGDFPDGAAVREVLSRDFDRLPDGRYVARPPVDLSEAHLAALCVTCERIVLSSPGKAWRASAVLREMRARGMFARARVGTDHVRAALARSARVVPGRGGYRGSGA